MSPGRVGRVATTLRRPLCFHGWRTTRLSFARGGRMDSAAVPSPGTTVAATGSLSEREREILAFERQWWKYAGAKETAIRDLFDLSATRYYQTLNALIDRPEALVHDPMLVKRLRRLRTTRQRTRSARRLGIDA
jgi:hypothetical protein